MSILPWEMSITKNLKFALKCANLPVLKITPSVKFSKTTIVSQGNILLHFCTNLCLKIQITNALKSKFDIRKIDT